MQDPYIIISKLNPRFHISLTMQLSIILVNNQLDVLFQCIYLFQFSYMFRATQWSEVKWNKQIHWKSASSWLLTRINSHISHNTAFCQKNRTQSQRNHKIWGQADKFCLHLNGKWTGKDIWMKQKKINMPTSIIFNDA